MPQVAREAKGGWVVGASPVPRAPAPQKVSPAAQGSSLAYYKNLAAAVASQSRCTLHHGETGRRDATVSLWCFGRQVARRLSSAQTSNCLRLARGGRPLAGWHPPEWSIQPRGRSGAAAAPAPVSGTNVLLSGAASACSRVARAAGGWVVLLFPYARWVGGV